VSEQKIHYQLLRIDLTTQQSNLEEIPFELYLELVGGKGIGSKLLLDELEPKVDPLGPGNKMIFVTGPLSGTLFPTSNRYGVLFKSPLTGGYAECYSGGRLAERMIAAGVQVVIIEGAAKSPVYLEITEKSAKFQDATTLWGKDTIQTYEALQIDARKDADMVCIGPAGENLVKIACLQNSKWHSAGRCGPGAVMGSKKLKAIVFSGKEKSPLNQRPEFRALVQKILEKLRAQPDTYGKDGFYRQFGTPIIADWANELGCFTSRYFTQGYSPHADKINAHAMKEQIFKKHTGCWNCPFTCGKFVEVAEGEYKCAVEGPEYETIALIGGVCDIRDIRAVAMLNEYCDRMGIDTISAGSLAGFLIEAKRRNLIPGAETLTIDYDNPLGVLDFFKLLVKKEGLGAEFAQGSKYVAEKYGLEDLVMHVKGLDFAGYDPRSFRGFTLSYGVAPEGPTHLRSVFHGIERNMPNRLEYENKAAPMLSEEDRMAILDSLIVCKFIRGVLDWGTITEIYNTIFETHVDNGTLREIAGKIVTLSRKFNVREGFSRKDDYMPPRTYKEALPKRNGETPALDREKYDMMLSEYYKLRGWSNDGKPE
jgi:aldehyde:ferredoxin oxidoreductase